MRRRLLKSVVRLILRLLYRVEAKGLEHIDNAGPRALVVVNHVSFLDGAILMALMSETPVFAIYTGMANRWWLKPFHGIASLHPIDNASPLAAKSLIKKLKEGRPCVIFPEGRISVTGALMKIYGGPAYIADRTDAVIVPVRIDGAELTPFSRLGEGQVRRRWFPKIRVTVLPPTRLEVDPGLKGKARRRVANLKLYDVMSDMVFRTTDRGGTLFEAILHARHRHGGSFKALSDISGTTLTHDRLLVGCLALGRRLAELSRPREHVAVLLPTVNAAAVTFLALQAFGRVPAMLNFTAGRANLEAALHTAEIRTVLTARSFVEQAKLEELVEALAKKADVVYLEDLRERIGLKEKAAAWLESWAPRRRYARQGVGRDEPAAILFTSGSEGRPKAVVLSHRNMLANCAQISARLDFNERDKLFNAMPLFHSFGLTGALVLPLVAGVGVFLYPSPLHYRIVPEMVYDQQATITFGTNSFLKGYGRAADPYDFRSLRYVVAGAEAVQGETREQWFDKFGLRILEGYGATETAPVISLNTPMHYRRGTVGRFLPGMEWRLEPVEGLDEGGELFVKGPNIMLGYLMHDRPGELVPPKDGWYDTGDLVAVDAEGFITIQGRAKRFAKLGGEMVSLGAIEEVVQAISAEAQHAIIVTADKRKGERIVLATTDDRLSRDAVRDALRKHGQSDLAAPAEIVRIAQIPLLGTGKIDYPAVGRAVEEARQAAGTKEPVAS